MWKMDPRRANCRWVDPQGFTVKVQAGRNGDLHWTAALRVERKRQLCHVFGGLA